MTDPVAAAALLNNPALVVTNNDIALQTSLTLTPDRLAVLTRQVELNAILGTAPTPTELNLTTPAGPVVLGLPQLAAVEQAKLQQQLLTIFETQQPVTLFIQPGNPTSQASLILPATTGLEPAVTAAAVTAANVTQQTVDEAGNLLTPNAVPVVPGSTLQGVVLPNTAVTPTPLIVANPALAAEDAAVILAAAVPPLETLNPAVTPSGTVPPPFLSLAAQEGLGSYVLTPGVTPSEDEAGAVNEATPIVPTTPVSTGPEESETDTGALLGSYTPAISSQSVSLVAGSSLTLQISSVVPATAEESLAPASAGATLATVTGAGPGGGLFLSIGSSTVFVRDAAQVPIGTQLLVEIAKGSGGTKDPLLLAPDKQSFPALQQMMAAIQGADASALHAALASRLPQSPDALSGALLLFLSAARKGDLTGWLGNDAPDLLSRLGKAELMGKVIEELQQSVETAKDPSVGEWRAYSIPLNMHGQFSVAQMYVHNERQGRNAAASGANDPKQIRFIIDVRMSRLGNLQLDGFLRKKQLDLIIRSENQLPLQMAQQLRDSYTQSLTNINYVGALTFQFGRQGWLTPQHIGDAKAIVT